VPCTRDMLEGALIASSGYHVYSSLQHPASQIREPLAGLSSLRERSERRRCGCSTPALASNQANKPQWCPDVSMMPWWP
jgi:hypothetical protein